MTHRTLLALCFVCTTATLTTASTAGAEEVIPRSAGALPYGVEPILGLDPMKARLTMTASRIDPLRPLTPNAIVSSDEKLLIIVAAAIVGVVLIVAVFGSH